MLNSCRSNCNYVLMSYKDLEASDHDQALLRQRVLMSYKDLEEGHAKHGRARSATVLMSYKDLEVRAAGSELLTTVEF